MAKAIITFKLMPESPDVDLEAIKTEALKIAEEAGAIGQLQSKIEPIAFGLKAVLILLITAKSFSRCCFICHRRRCDNYRRPAQYPRILR